VSKTRVIIADDHPAIRAGLRLALEEGGFIVCGEASDAPSAVELALREQPDVCLFDVYMGGGGGISAARAISQRLPRTQIVMLTVSQDDDDLLDAIRAGAAGYLLKDIDLARLVPTLEAALAGEAAMPRRLVTALVNEVRSRGKRRYTRLARRASVALTGRECEVLELLSEGLTTAEIAKRLGISPVTVRRNISNVVRKLDVPDRAAALKLLA